MKILLLILCLCTITFFAPSTAQAQQPFPIAADNPVWNTLEDYFWDPGVTQNTWTMTADTQLCGQTYQIAEAVSQNPWVPGYYKGYIRNQGDQVYYRTDNNCSNQEQLMYDYSLTAGDTFFMDHDPFQAAINNDSTFWIVQSVSVANYNGVNRQVIDFDPNQHPLPFKWIRGIGDIYHPFHTLLYRGTEEYLQTNCLDSLGIQIFQNPSVDSCIIVVGTPEPYPQIKVDIYPNPARHGWKISTGKNRQIDAVEIYDQVGKLVFRDAPQSPEAYQLPALSEAGIYFIRLRIGNESWSGKLIQIGR